ncbi:hypothetical protein ACJX0J_038460, partial [Zea mays]
MQLNNLESATKGRIRSGAGLAFQDSVYLLAQLRCCFVLVFATLCIIKTLYCLGLLFIDTVKCAVIRFLPKVFLSFDIVAGIILFTFLLYFKRFGWLDTLGTIHMMNIQHILVLSILIFCSFLLYKIYAIMKIAAGAMLGQLYYMIQYILTSI